MPEPRMVTVVPSPDLRLTEYVPGISPDGTALPEPEAKLLIEAGLVVVKPEPKPAPARTED